MQFGAMNLYAASRKSGPRTLSPSFTSDTLVMINKVVFLCAPMTILHVPMNKIHGFNKEYL